VDLDAVRDAVGADVELVADGPGGAAGFDAGLDGSTGYSLAWQACGYEADDGTTYEVGRLVGKDGKPDAGGFDQLTAMVEASGTGTGGGTSLDDLGDEAFYDEDDELVVRAGDTTLVVGFGFVSDPSPEDRQAFADIARVLLDTGTGDITTLCTAAAGATPDRWGTVGEPLVGSGSSGVGDQELEYAFCSIDIEDADNSNLEVSSGGPELFASHAARAEEDGTAVAVDGPGDAAVWFHDRLYVQAGHNVLVVSGETGADDPLDQATITPIATKLAG
jgi:hypothetical protein